MPFQAVFGILTIRDAAKEQAIQILNSELAVVKKWLKKPSGAEPSKGIPLELLENKGKFEKADVAQLVEQRFRKP